MAVPIVLAANAQYTILPVSPPRLTYRLPQDNRKDIIINVGEVVDFGPSKPEMISFNSFFPANEDTYTQRSPYPRDRERTPVQWVNHIKTMEGAEIRLVIGSLVVGIFLLDDFNVVWEGGRGSDLEYSLRFIEHEEISVRHVSSGEIRRVNSRFDRTGYPNRRTHYTIRMGDTKISIARRTGLSHSDIDRLNIFSNDFQLVPGKELIIEFPPHRDIIDIPLGQEYLDYLQSLLSRPGVTEFAEVDLDISDTRFPRDAFNTFQVPGTDRFGRPIDPPLPLRP